jgi:hypothetical protein
VKARLGDAAGFFGDYDRLTGPEVGFFRGTVAAAASRDLESSVRWLRRVRQYARGLRRSEGWLRPIAMKASTWRETGSFAGGTAVVEESRAAAEGDGVAAPAPMLRALFDLELGRRLPLKGLGEVLVESIREDENGTFELTLSRSGGRPLVVLLSTTPTQPYFRRTARGHYLSYRGSDATPEETSALDDVSTHL